MALLLTCLGWSLCSENIPLCFLLLSVSRCMLVSTRLYIHLNATMREFKFFCLNISDLDQEIFSEH